MAAGGGGDAQSGKRLKRPEAAQKGGGGDAESRNKRKRREAAAKGGGDARTRTHDAPAERGGDEKEDPRPVTPEEELALMWKQKRHHGVSKEDRAKLVTEALHLMNGNYLEIAKSRVTRRILQKCVKWCSDSERQAVFDALHAHLLTLSRQKNAAVLIMKIIKLATYPQLTRVIFSFRDDVASLLCDTIGGKVLDCAFQKATPDERMVLLCELYTNDRQLLRNLKHSGNSLLEAISMLALQESTVQQYMTTTVIQPIFERGIVEYSIVHTLMLEYLTIADKTSASDVIRQLIPHLTQAPAKKKISSEPLLIQIMHTREGLKLGLGCLKHGSAKERKKIIKSLKGHIMKLALDNNGCLFLVSLLSIVDDTKLVTKIVIKELAKELKKLMFEKNGRRPLLQLLHPFCSRYLPRADLACLNYSVNSLISKDEASEAMLLTCDSKMDPFQWRHELLIGSELAEALVETCIENVGELLQANFGKDVLYEVAVGGKDNVLESITGRIHLLHDAIASQAACPKTDDVKHAFNNYQSSGIIRRMILDCPAFAATLWTKALEGKCELYANGHSSKVVTAYLESTDSKVKDLAKSELQALIDRGILK